MNGKNSALVAMMLAVLVQTAFASQISVSIMPKDRAVEVLQLYPDEIGELEIAVSNNGTGAAENLNLRISVQGPLSIMEDSSIVAISNQEIESLAPGETKLLFARVKPRELSREKQFVYVNYGFETFTHVVATYVEIIESPLEVQARLAKSALDLGEPSKMVVTLRNKSGNTVNNIRAELVLPTGLSAKSLRLESDLLSPGESIADREFAFDVDPTVTGEKRVILTVSFEDSRGVHSIERDFFLDVQNRRLVLYMIIAAIVVLVVAALYLKRKPSKFEKPLEQPEVKELEGKEIKKVAIEGKEIKK